MSQEQPRKPKQDEAIKYGDVLNVGGELASKPITPRDAATVQSVETQIFGKTPKGGPAALMESAAAKNERAGLVTHNESTYLARNEGVTLSHDGTNLGGNRLLSETLAGEKVGQFVEGDGDDDATNTTKGTMDIEEAFGSTVDDDLPAASVKAPQVRPTKDFDFITNHQDTTLNPRFSQSQHHENTQSNVPSGQRATYEENPDVISSVPGGMGASMGLATADHRQGFQK